MFHSFRSFDRRSQTFADALQTQKAMAEVCNELAKTRFSATGGDPLKSTHLKELWGGVLGTVDLSKAITKLPMAVDATIPPEYVPTVRGLGGVIAAYAFCELAASLVQVQDLNDDLEVREAFIDGWARFEQRRQAANQVQEGMGCNLSQSWQTMRDIHDQSSNPDLMKQMAAICALAGRMYKSFGYQRRDQPNREPEEVRGSKVGGKIEDVFPTELAMLADEDLGDMQAIKILRDNAPVLEKEGKEAKCRGPLVMCIDESGSMSDKHYGFNGRNTWAKAAAVALTRIAWQEDRAVKVVHFGSGTVSQSVPKDDYRAMFEMARSFLSGGTSFGAALIDGRAQVANLEAQGHKGADIVLITDGVEPNYDEHNREIDLMVRDHVKLWTIAIGVDIEQKAPVRARAERYTHAADSQLGNPATATQLAQGLNQAAMGNDPDDPWDLN